MCVVVCLASPGTAAHASCAPQCVQQLGASSADAAAVALAAGELCSKLGDAAQAEVLLRQAYAAAKVRGWGEGGEGGGLLMRVFVAEEGGGGGGGAGAQVPRCV